ncbi:hypothetical protein WJX81_004835 [Elliptochloris bilobata]|uniref:BZIP domain-containing protein n=1 Tax=Elliptochloris bilobata TaxID=381761 RepID=A0AAW1QY04_9CHLO
MAFGVVAAAAAEGTAWSCGGMRLERVEQSRKFCVRREPGARNPDAMSSAAMQHFSRFPSFPVEALADLDAVLDWTAKPAVQRTLSSVLAAELGDAVGKAAAVPASPSGPLAAAATTSGGTSGGTSGAVGASAPVRGARAAKRAASEEEVHSESDHEDEDEDASDDGAITRRRRPRRSTRFAGGGQASKPTEKRRVGRPIEYYGDADAPNLTPAERRRIRRRIANRESARRVRSRRLGELEEAQKTVAALQANCMRLREHTAASEAQCASLEAEAVEMDARWRAAAAETSRLCSELERMRRLFQACTGSAAPKSALAAHASATQVAAIVEMETATTAELAKELAAPQRCAPAPEGGKAADAPVALVALPDGAARAGSEMLLDTHMCGADDSFAAPFGGFLVCA